MKQLRGDREIFSTPAAILPKELKQAFHAVLVSTEQGRMVLTRLLTDLYFFDEGNNGAMHVAYRNCGLRILQYCGLVKKGENKVLIDQICKLKRPQRERREKTLKRKD